jgi:hypothetical protein
MLAQTHLEEKRHPSESFDGMLARTHLDKKRHPSESFDGMLARTHLEEKTPRGKALMACLHKHT